MRVNRTQTSECGLPVSRAASTAASNTSAPCSSRACANSSQAWTGANVGNSETWLVARAAMPAGQRLPCPLRYYRPIPEFIAGYGLMFQHGA